MHLQHPKNIKSVRVLRQAPQRRQLFLSIIVVLYALVGYWVYQTVGIPYETALAEAEELDKKKQLESHEDAIEKGGITVASFSDFDDDDDSSSSSSSSMDEENDVDVLMLSATSDSDDSSNDIIGDYVGDYVGDREEEEGL